MCISLVPFLSQRLELLTLVQYYWQRRRLPILCPLLLPSCLSLFLARSTPPHSNQSFLLGTISHTASRDYNSSTQSIAPKQSVSYPPLARSHSADLGCVLSLPTLPYALELSEPTTPAIPAPTKLPTVPQTTATNCIGTDTFVGYPLHVLTACLRFVLTTSLDLPGRVVATLLSYRACLSVKEELLIKQSKRSTSGSTQRCT